MRHVMAGYDDSDTLRVCIFRPYRRGLGPSFRLTLWATGRIDSRGQSILGYRLTMHYTRIQMRQFPIAMGRGVTETIFEGEDFAGSPMHGDDSDDTVRALMGFLTLRPGDTDADYFASDTEAQRAYRDHHGQALAMEVYSRFGED